MLSVFPKYYNPSESKNIEIFSRRLKTARLTYVDRQKALLNPTTHTNEGEITQAKLAKYVGVSTMTISKYENHKIKKIPVKKLRKICEYLDVTPHYLLGLVSRPEQCLEIDKEGNVKTKDGKPHILERPMAFDPSLCVMDVNNYRQLFYEDSELFWLINIVICSSNSLRNYYKGILASILSYKQPRQNDETQKV